MNDQQQKMNPRQYFNHLLHHQKIYLCILLLVLSTAILVLNYLHQKPLLMGGESYYYLSSAPQELLYNPLTLIFKLIPDQLLFLLPPLISLGTMVLFYVLAEKIKISEKNTFFIALFYILTPTFIFTSLTLSSYALYLLLVLGGANLLLLESRKKYFSIIPFLLASCIDTFSAMLLLAGIAGYFFIFKKSRERFPTIIIASVAAMLIVNAVILNTPFFIGPFLIQNRASDLISDLGGFSGVGFFSILLAFIGLIIYWQKKNLPLLISTLVIFIAAYVFNTHTVFFLSLLIVILASAGFEYLLEQNWKISFLRNAVLLLLLLGISFSAVAYHDRLSHYSPTSVDQKALGWIQRNTPKEAVVLSAPENSYYISYFAQRKPVFALHQDYRQQDDLSQRIFTSYYIDNLFPLLDENKVSIIYVSEDMKRKFPAQQEFLFLLQNERFKLLYFTEEAEVWSFEEAKQ